MFRDKFDLEVTCSGDAALQAYLSGIECSLNFDRSGINELVEAVAQDDDFALAHAALGRQLFTHGHHVESAAHLDTALSLSARVTPRERGAIAVIVATARFDPQAIAMARSHVAMWPQDIFVLAHLLGPFGLLAFSGTTNWCEQNVVLLAETESAYPAGDWWRLTTQGFFEAEQGRLVEAREHCELAWSIGKNGNCAHSLAHLHFEAGAIDEGKAFINDWVAEFGAQSDMRHHLIWHLSFLDLESGLDSGQVFEWYDRELDFRVSDPTPLETLCDNAALLWRCYLAGKDVPKNVREDMLRYAEESFPDCGFAFADVHRATLAAMHPDRQVLTNLLQQLREVADRNGTHVASCVRQYAEGFGAFVEEAYDDTVSLLGPVLTDSVLLGGSNPQRRIIEDTYLEACVRSGRLEQARAVLHGRNRKTSVFDGNMLDLIGDGRDER